MSKQQPKTHRALMYVIMTSRHSTIAESLDKLHSRCDAIGSPQTNRDMAVEALKQFYKLKIHEEL